MSAPSPYPFDVTPDANDYILMAIGGVVVPVSLYDFLVWLALSPTTPPATYIPAQTDCANMSIATRQVAVPLSTLAAWLLLTPTATPARLKPDANDFVIMAIGATTQLVSLPTFLEAVGSSSWSPADHTTNQQMWLDFSDTTTLFTDTACTIPASPGDNVRGVVDKSPAGHNATNATSQASSPTLSAIGAMNALFFNGTSQFLSIAAAMVAAVNGSDKQFTIHITERSTGESPGTSRVPIGCGRSSTTVPIFNLLKDTDGGAFIQKRDDANTISKINVGAWTLDVVNTWSIRQNGTTVDLLKNGFLLLSASPQDVGATTINTGSLGAFTRTSTASFHKGEICEVLVYSEAQSTLDFYGANNYLLAKWGAPVPVDLFMIAGQSNAEGRGTAGPAVTAGVAHYLSTASMFGKLSDPVGGADTGSAWPAFANQWWTSTARPTVWIEQATGGTGILPQSSTPNWDPTTGTLYPAARDALNAAIARCAASGLPVGRVFIAWSDGETDGEAIDAGTATGPELQSATANLFAAFRADITLPVRLFVIRTGQRSDNTKVAAYQAVRTAQDNVCAGVSYALMIYTDTITFTRANSKMKPSPDVYHYSQTGLDLVGTNGAIAAAALV